MKSKHTTCQLGMWALIHNHNCNYFSILCCWAGTDKFGIFFSLIINFTNKIVKSNNDIILKYTVLVATMKWTWKKRRKEWINCIMLMFNTHICIHCGIVSKFSFSNHFIFLKREFGFIHIQNLNDMFSPVML